VQLFGASIVLSPAAALTLPKTLPSTLAILSLLALMLLSTSLAYLLYFFLLEQVGPTRTSSVTFLVPVFGTFWGILLLQEPVSFGLFLGMAVIFASIGLVTGMQFPRLKRSLEPEKRS
jgi:drug/metabolite transporter (DMT)-like permease